MSNKNIRRMEQIAAMLMAGEMITESRKDTAETELKEAIADRELELRERTINLQEENIKRSHNKSLELEYDMAHLEDSDGDGYLEIKPGTSFKDSNTTKGAVLSSHIQLAANYGKENPGFTAWAKSFSDDPADHVDLMSEWNTYKNMGVNHESGTIINEDLYRMYDNSYGGLGKLWAVDLDSSGYLGHNDVIQAKEFIGSILDVTKESEQDYLRGHNYANDLTFKITPEHEDVLREWGLLGPGEFFMDSSGDFDEGAVHNKDLQVKIRMRADAYLEGVVSGENKNLMTERAYNEYIQGENIKNLQISDAVLGSVSVSGIKENYQQLYTNLTEGIINAETGYLLGANPEYRDLDITQPKNQDKISKASNVETSSFLLSLRTGGQGYGHLKRFSDDIKADGRPVMNSGLHKVYSGLRSLGLTHQADNLLLSVQQYGKYNEYISSGKAYVQGTVEDPKKLENRAKILNVIDNEYEDTGATVRDLLFEAGKANDQARVDQLMSFLGIEFKQQGVDTGEASEFLDLLLSQINAYAAL